MLRNHFLLSPITFDFHSTNANTQEGTSYKSFVKEKAVLNVYRKYVYLIGEVSIWESDNGITISDNKEPAQWHSLWWSRKVIQLGNGHALTPHHGDFTHATRLTNRTYIKVY